MALFDVVRSYIEKDQRESISFFTFMNLALYHETHGYYSRDKKKIGKEGDFYTSVSVGEIFGEVLADVFAEMMGTIGNKENLYLIEFGGGTGDLTRQILEAWKKNYPDVLSAVQSVMIEKSPYHRELQKENLENFQVNWFEEWDEFRTQVSEIHGVRGVIFSNELLDAFPVYMVEYHNGSWKEVRVGWDSTAAELCEVLDEINQPEVLEYLRREQQNIPAVPGYRIEVNLASEEWLSQVAHGITEGYLVTIDYGYLREQLYAPQRKKGTLMCYYRHTATDNPFNQLGEQDITTHINFSSLMEVGEKAGLKNLGFFTQSEFLINGGILSKLQGHQETDPFHGRITKQNRAIRQLIMPGGMGDTFKVLIQGKGKLDMELSCLKPKGWV